MAGVKTFKELLVWQESHKLVLAIYLAVKNFPKFEEFGLSSQMRRSSSSIPSNIAEGFKKKSVKESCHFYNIADCSLEELKYQIILSRDLQYIDSVKFTELSDQSEKVGRLLSGWIKSQK